MIIKGRPISKGRAEGVILKLNEPLSFLGGVEASTGEIKVEKGGNVAGKILVFPNGKGSTVGSFVMYDLKVHNKAPAAIINSTAETIVATGAVISSIPMIDGVDIDLLKDSDRVMLDADKGNVELLDVKIIESVSSVILIDGKILMLKRPITVRSFPGVWSLCAGKIERGETPEAAAVREIKEETGILVLKPLRYLLPIHVREKDIIWKVYPFLFKADGVVPNINSENDEFKLFDITELKELKLVEGTLDVIKRLVIDH
jgi:hypothetical protein